MIRDSLKKPFEGIDDRLPDTWERAQVGIGTLIVFIAMVLVAAIAAGVLINTAGFLQSQAEQTGEESSAQVTNQLQVLSTTGVVTTGASSADDTQLKMEATGSGGSGEALTIVNELTISSGDLSDAGTDNTLEVDGGDGSVSLDDTKDLTFTLVNESAYEVTHNGETLTINTDAGETLVTGTGDLTITNNYEAMSSDVVIGQAGGTGGLVVDSLKAVAAEVTISGSTSDIEIVDGSSFAVDTSLSTVVITNQDGDSISVDADGESFDLGVSVTGEDEVLDLGDDNTYTLTGPDGQSIDVDNAGSNNGYLKFEEEGGASATVVLSNGGVEASVSGEVDGQSLSYVDAESAGSVPKIDRLEVLVTQAPGAGDIDMRKTTISFIAPDGSHDLVYSENTLEEDTTYTLAAVQDEDDTMPVMTSGDRMKINIDPGTLEAGTMSELHITTPSGATKSLQVRVPDSLANQEAVSL